MALLLAAVACALLAHAPRARAATDCQSKCVMLIQINGLEPKDVTKQNTPFLWSLAHSGDSANDPQAGGYPALAQRNGWAWQAARDVMSTGDGPSTWGLLTGDTAEQSGDPADLFAKPNVGSSGLTYYQTGGSGTTDCGSSADPCDPVMSGNAAGTTVLDAALGSSDTIGIFNGDPALCRMINEGITDNSALYDVTPADTSSAMADIASAGQSGCPDLYQTEPTPPSSTTTSCSDGSSCNQQSPYCPPPSSWPAPSSSSVDVPAVCDAPDGQVLAQATQDMANGTYPSMTFIDLAEVGAVKQRSGDSDCFSELGCGTSLSGTPVPAEPAAVSHALETTDAELAAFVAALNENKTTSWQNTYLMVVGSHGYEATPAALRVPDPNVIGTSPTSLGGVVQTGSSPPQAGTGDLSTFVDADSSHRAVLIPQGTMATVYYTGDPSLEEQTLTKLYGDLCGSVDTTGGCGSEVDGSPSLVNQACENLFAQAQTAGASGLAQATPDCIEDVYYVDPSLIPASDASKFQPSQFLFGVPGDPGYPTPSDPSYDPNPHCQSSDPGGLFFDNTKNCDASLLGFYQGQHASWHLNPLQPSSVITDPRNPGDATTVFEPTGAGGALVIELDPGWAAGPLAGTQDSTDSTAGVTTVGTPIDPVDPYLASTGGPRDRAVAAIVSGPSSGSEPVAQFPDSPTGSQGQGDGLAPVMDPKSYDPATEDSSSTDVCSKDFMAAHAAFQDNLQAGTLAVDQANASPGNDSAAFGSPVFLSGSDSYVPGGMECQAQTIDFAPTIEALQGTSSEGGSADHADARFLDEAFAKCLGANNTTNSGSGCGSIETLGTEVQPKHEAPPPVVLPPPQIIYQAPPPQKPYGFTGLMRHAQAQVVDQDNDTVPYAPPGAYLSSLRITADFGKPLSEVTITLYKRAPRVAADRRHRASAARTHLTAIVRFCPFTVKRAPNVELRFVVPTAYQPDHVGLAVHQARQLPSATGPGCGQAPHNAFVAFGRPAGAIVPILDASLLHKVKPCPAALALRLRHRRGVRLQSVTILRGRRVVRRITGRRLRGRRLVIPAARLPGGLLIVREQWIQLKKGKRVTRSFLTSFPNCTATQRRSIGQSRTTSRG